MYKLKKGVELPKKFKVKVNPDESIALQEHLFSIGVTWCTGERIVDHIDKPYIYVGVQDSGISFNYGEQKHTFHHNHRYLPQIDFQDYFEKTFPEKWCIKVTEENYKELDVWMHRNWKNYSTYIDIWKINSIDTGCYFHSIGETKGGWGGKFIKSDDYTLITTEQFREQFGDKEEKYFIQGDERAHIIPKEIFENISEKVKEAKNRMEQKDSIIEDNKKVIATLDAENKKLKDDVSQLETETLIQSSDIERYKTHIELLKDQYFFEIKKLSKQNKKLKKQIKMLSLR